MMFGLVRVWKQIEAKRKRGEWIREDYLIMGSPNQLFRWCITTVIAIVHMLRIIYFDQGYCLLTLIFFGLFHLNHLISHLFASDSVQTPHWASDWVQNPRDFTSFVNRLIDFQFWFMTTKMLLLVFLLSWVPFLKCSLLGPKKAFFLWFVMGLFTFAFDKLYGDPYSQRYLH